MPARLQLHSYGLCELTSATCLPSNLQEAITADVYSSRQLVELLCQNSDLLSLCEDTVGSLSASRGALAQAAAGMCNAAWQLVGRKAEQLEAARQCRDAAAAAAVRMLQNAAAGEAAAATVQALHVATLLTDVSGWAQRALLQHGPTIAGSLQLVAQAWVEGSLPESSQDRLSRLLAMWAAEAPWHASAAARRAEAKALTPPCLGIAGGQVTGALLRRQEAHGVAVAARVANSLLLPRHVQACFWTPLCRRCWLPRPATNS